MQIKFTPLASLEHYASNSRKHSDHQIAELAASILQFGWTIPILADGQGIVAGHCRALAAQQLYDQGHALQMANGTRIPAGKVPTIDCSGWNENQRRAYVIADNKLPMNATWDFDLLRAELTTLQAADFDLAVLGFAKVELADIMGGNANAGEEPPGEEPPAGPSAKTCPHCGGELP